MPDLKECSKCGNYSNCTYFLRCRPNSGTSENCPGYFIEKQEATVNIDFEKVKKQAQEARLNKKLSKKKTKGSKGEYTWKF